MSKIAPLMDARAVKIILAVFMAISFAIPFLRLQAAMPTEEMSDHSEKPATATRNIMATTAAFHLRLTPQQDSVASRTPYAHD